MRTTELVLTLIALAVPVSAQQTASAPGPSAAQVSSSGADQSLKRKTACKCHEIC